MENPKKRKIDKAASKKNISKKKWHSGEDAIQRIGEATKKIKEGFEKGNVAASEETIPYLQDIHQFCHNFEDPKQRTVVADELANQGIAPFFVHYLNHLTHEGACCPLEGNGWIPFDCLLQCCWIGTDVSEKLGKQLCNYGILGLLLQLLKHLKNNFNEDWGTKQRYVAQAAISIIHNCSFFGDDEIRKCCDTKPDLVSTIEWYAKNTSNDENDEHDLLAPLSAITLAEIVDENNNDIIHVDSNIIKRILSIFERSLQDENHSAFGLKSIEVAKGLTLLARNKENSTVMLKDGILDSLFEMLTKGNDQEKEVAAGTIWKLAFEQENARVIRSNQKIMESLKVMSEIESTLINSEDIHQASKQAARGALWVLKHFHEGKILKHLKQKENVKKETLESDSWSIDAQNVEIEEDKEKDVFQSLQSTSDHIGHIMISYQWDSQDLILKIKQKLEAAGYKTWMDVEKMSGDMLDAMAEAVENSVVVLMCYSKKYKDSKYCETEAKYAYNRNVPVIPLRIEEDYKPDGWLGALIALLFYVDFAKRTNFDDSLTKLIKEIEEKLKKNPLEKAKEEGFEVVDGRQQNKGKVEAKQTLSNNLATWTNQDVVNWSQENNIKNLETKSLDGSVLVFLKKLRFEAPEFYYRWLFEQLGLKDIRDIMTFTNSLSALM